MRLPLRLALALGLSGFAAVLYEVLWVRILGDLFGHTAFAIQVVLTVFFAGLAAGSLLTDRLARARLSPLRVYAAVELALAGAALAVPAAVRGLTPLYDRLSPLDLTGPPALAARLAAAGALLLVPTALMGATFPLVVRGAMSSSIPSLYAINTIGGAAGAWLSAFVLLPLVGLPATLALGAVANVVSAVLAYSVKARGSVTNRRPSSDEPIASSVLPRGILRLLLFATGFVALGLEVLWSRALDQVLAGSVYSFATVLAVFLVGIALGGVIARQLLGRWNPTAVFVAVELVLAAYVVASVSFLRTVPAAADQLQAVLGPGFLRRGIVLESLLAGLVLLVPAVCMGIVFPLLLEMDRPQGLGALGSLLAGNTLGALVGPLVAGTVLLPRLGLGRSLLVLAIVTWTTSATLLPFVRRGSRTALAASLLLVAAWMVQAPTTLLLGIGPRERVLEVREDPAATVAVVESRAAVPERRLKINRSFSLGGGAGVFTERRQGHLPMLLHPDPQRVLVLGVGTGNTLGAVALHRPRSLTAVELVEGVLALARRHFEWSNEGVLRRPGVKVLCADARRVVRSSPDRYDLVIADLFHPWQAWVGGLYSSEHFLAVGRTLAPGGVFCQWLPLYQVSTDDLRTVVRTFLGVYPHAEAWLGNFGSTTPVLALCGSEAPIRLQWDRWRRAMADTELRARLEAVYLDRPAEVYGGYVGDHSILMRFAGPGPTNTVDRPTIEFSAPRALFGDGLEQEKRRSLAELIGLAPRAVPLAGGPGSPEEPAVTRNLESVRDLIGAFLARETGELAGALRQARTSVERAEDYDVPAKALVALAWEASDTRPREAEEAFRVALVLQPRDENALTGLGMAYLSQRRWDEASRAFRGALAVRPDWPEAVEGLRKLDSLRDAR